MGYGVRIFATTRTGLRNARPKPRKLDDHDISIGQTDTVGKTQTVRAVEMHVHIAGPPVSVELEMMMLDVCQTVTHLRWRLS